jgi:hypothetical protein
MLFSVPVQYIVQSGRISFSTFYVYCGLTFVIFFLRFSSKSLFIYLYSLSLLPWLLLGTVVIAVNRLPTLDTLDALHAVELLVLRNLPNCLNQLPSYLNQVPSCLNLPERVGIVVHYSLLLDMFGALHVVVPLLRDPNQVPSHLGTVTIAVHHLLLQRRHMLDALHAVVVVVYNLRPNQVPFMLFPSCQSVPVLPFLPHRVSHNVIVAAFRCHLTTISPAVWNAEIAEGTCLPDLCH